MYILLYCVLLCIYNTYTSVIKEDLMMMMMMMMMMKKKKKKKKKKNRMYSFYACLHCPTHKCIRLYTPKHEGYFSDHVM